jgi:hypothetical protein
MTEPITRRSAIMRLLAAVSTAKLFVWEKPRDRQGSWPAEPTKIIPGERFGDIFVDMNESEVEARLGAPCEIQHHEGENLEQTLKVFEYINKMTGRNLTAKDALPLRPPTTHLLYDRLGMEVCLENGRVAGISAYTGILSGYTDKIKSHFPADPVLSGATPLRTMSDVQIQFGAPHNVVSLSHAPIPETNFVYRHGIAFAGRVDDGRLAMISVRKRKTS